MKIKKRKMDSEKNILVLREKQTAEGGCLWQTNNNGTANTQHTIKMCIHVYVCMTHLKTQNGQKRTGGKQTQKKKVPRLRFELLSRTIRNLDMTGYCCVFPWANFCCVSIQYRLFLPFCVCIAYMHAYTTRQLQVYGCCAACVYHDGVFCVVRCVYVRR